MVLIKSIEDNFVFNLTNNMEMHSQNHNSFGWIVVNIFLILLQDAHPGFSGCSLFKILEFHLFWFVICRCLFSSLIKSWSLIWVMIKSCAFLWTVHYLWHSQLIKLCPFSFKVPHWRNFENNNLYDTFIFVKLFFLGFESWHSLSKSWFLIVNPVLCLWYVLDFLSRYFYF